MRIWKSFGCFITLLVIMISSGILALSLARVDDCPYYVEIESELSDVHDSLEEVALQQTDECRKYSREISIEEGDNLEVTCSVDNSSDVAGNLVIDLFTDEWDNDYCEKVLTVFPGKQDITVNINYGRIEHPQNAELRFYTPNDVDLTLSNLKVRVLEQQKDKHPLIAVFVTISFVVFVLSAICIILYIFVFAKKRGERIRACTRDRFDLRKEIILYLSIILIITAVLLFVYKDINISNPIVYAGGDDLGVYTFAKTIRENGLSLITPLEGGVTGADLFDYIYSDKLSFALVKIITLFTDNPYLTINLFYFLNYYLIAISATFVCRRLEKGRVSSLVIGVLYAFCPYITMRYAHMWLVPYFMLPFACLLAINIINGKYEANSGEIRNNKSFWVAVLVSFACAFTGLYYAFFSAAIIAAAVVIRMLTIKGAKKRSSLYAFVFVVFIVVGVVINIVPNIVYWQINGNNPSGELAMRNPGEAEYYGLKFVQLLLPRPGHRIELLSKINSYYASHFYLVNENQTASLGLVAGVGFILSLLYILIGKQEDSAVSKLNLSAFLIGTIGGIGAFISVFVHIPMRCYNRISLIIMFLSLIIIASLLDKIVLKKKGLGCILSVCVLAFGIYDQTGVIGSNEYPSYQSANEFINEVETAIHPGDAVFVLPYDDWPSPKVPGSYQLHIGYIESEDIYWSYGAMEGREEAEWQRYIESQDTETMIQLILDEGYDGIYMDKKLYSSKYGSEITEQKTMEITNYLNKDPIISTDGTMCFWSLGNN